MPKYYVTVNPYGGGKKGLQILEKVLPVFENAQIGITVLETKYAGHARELARNTNMDGYNGFCCIGGDGTFHEIINGMMKREDKLRFPLGLITGGTGNSFMHDLDCLDPVEAVKRIIEGKKRSIDILKCVANDVNLYAFNIVGWGIPTDANNLAEKIRWIGNQRYNISSIIEVLRNKKRFARVEIDGNVIEADFAFIIARKAGRLKLLKLFPKVFSGKHIGDPAVDYRQVSRFTIKPEGQNRLNIDGEIVGQTPVRVEVLKKEIDVLV